MSEVTAEQAAAAFERFETRQKTLATLAAKMGGKALVEAQSDVLIHDGAMGLQPRYVRGPCAFGLDVRPGSWDLSVCDLARVRGNEHVPRLVFYGKVQDETAAMFVAMQYRCKGGIVDSRPEAELAERFQKAGARQGLEIWRAHYNTTPTDVRVAANEKERLLRLERTLTLDQVFWKIKTAQILLPENFFEVHAGAFVSELTASTRITEDWYGMQWPKWKGPDDTHAFHSLNYMLMAAELLRLYAWSSVETAGANQGIVRSTLEGNMGDGDGEGAYATDMVSDSDAYLQEFDA